MDSIQTGNTRIAVALSGGGHRAAAFSAGALTALLDSGLLPQIKVMTSTSGGSLINGAVACGRLASRAFGTDETDEVRHRVSCIVTMIEKTGISPYRFPPGTGIPTALVTLLFAGIAAIAPNAFIRYFLGFAIIQALLISYEFIWARNGQSKIALQ